MKLRLILPALVLFLQAAYLPTGLIAQEEEAPLPAEKSAEEHEKEDADSEKKDQATTLTKMKVFKVLEGEWTGKEKIDYNNNFPGLKNKPDMEWEDTWKGYFTQGGRYFEMEGATKGKLASTYRWVVTYDSAEEVYKAWSFGSTGFSTYEGELKDDGKSVLWTHMNELDNVDVEDTFEFRVDGNSCEAKGTTVIKTKDGDELDQYSKHTSTYTRKKVEI